MSTCADRGEGVSVNTTLSILAHEAGHRFLTRTLLFDQEADAYSADLLGRQGSHWSFFFNSEGSFLEGAKILDHGPGASPFRFESTEVFRRFSEFDLYLMGLIPAEQVPPSFFVSRDMTRGHSAEKPSAIFLEIVLPTSGMLTSTSAARVMSVFGPLGLSVV